MKTNLKNPRRGFTLLEIMVVVTIIGLLTVIALPNFIRAGNTSRLNTIYDNLRVVSDAKDQWALETGRGVGEMTDMNTLSNFFLHGVQPVINETYVPNPVGTPAFAQLPGSVTLPPYGPGAAIQAR